VILTWFIPYNVLRNSIFSIKKCVAFHSMSKLLIYLDDHNIKVVLHLAYGRAIVYFIEAIRNNQHVIFFQQDCIGIYFAA
jgi:pyruvate/2-oxoglutarate/acetoin dehydrogenase E1 component